MKGRTALTITWLYSAEKVCVCVCSYHNASLSRMKTIRDVNLLPVGSLQLQTVHHYALCVCIASDLRTAGTCVCQMTLLLVTGSGVCKNQNHENL